MSHAKQLHNRQYFDDSMEIINRKGLPGHLNYHQLKAGGFKNFRRTEPPTERENG